MDIAALTRHERMRLQFRDPFIGRMDDVPDFLAGLLIESGFFLRLFDLLEVAWINCAHDVEEELSGWLLLGGKLVMHVSLDVFIIFDLLEQLVHGQLGVVGQLHFIVLVVLEALLLAHPQLPDELGVDFLVVV